MRAMTSVNHIPQESNNFLLRPSRFFICSQLRSSRRLRSCPVLLKPFRPTSLASHRSRGGARLAWRRPGGDGGSSIFLNLGGYGRRGRGAGRPDGQAPRREMAPQKLERIGFAPGNGGVPEAGRPQYLVQVQGRVATFFPKDSLRLSAKKLQTLAPKRLKPLALIDIARLVGRRPAPPRYREPRGGAVVQGSAFRAFRRSSGRPLWT